MRLLLAVSLALVTTEIRAQEAQPEPERIEVNEGRPAIAGVAAFAAACAVAPLLGCVTAIPVVGVLVSPVVIGGGMGLAAWAAGALAGAKRIPIIPMAAAGILGVAVTSLLAIPPVALAALGGVIIVLTSSVTNAGVVLYFGGAGLFYVVLMLGAVGTAAALGVMAALLGRGVVDGESPLAPDWMDVPAAGAARTPAPVEEEEEEVEEVLEGSPEDTGEEAP